MITTLDILCAFDDCFKNKRSSNSAIAYEAERMIEDLPRLAEELSEHTYEPGESIAFVVRKPRYREVFAATFRDRIVHHWMCLRLTPIIESLLGDRRFNCRKGKGTLYGIKRLSEDVRSVSQNYTRDCWIAKGDIKSFFMSIDKEQLATMTDMIIQMHYVGDDKEDLRWVSRKIIMHSPEKKCVLNSPQYWWDKFLPPDKSLRTNPDGKGMPIGNLPSQLLANLVLLLALDTVLKDMGICHGGYVDDFYMISESKEKLLNAFPAIRESLSRYGLKLNEKKTYIQHYSKGVQFIGAFFKFKKRYVIPRVVNSFLYAVEKLKAAQGADEAIKAAASINSYIGMMVHHDTYRIRRAALRQFEGSKYCCVGIDYDKITIRKEHLPYEQIKQKVREGNPWELALADSPWRNTEREDNINPARQRILHNNRKQDNR